MEKVNPLQSAMMDERDSQIILRLFHGGLPKQYKDICGFNGHEFMLTIYGNHPQNLQFWCYVRPELTLAAEVINNIVIKVMFVCHGSLIGNSMHLSIYSHFRR